MKPPEMVLIIDDDPDIRIIARLSLSRVGGFVVEEATSGEEALAKLEKMSPDVVLLDMMMPHMDGLKVLSEIRSDKRHHALPVIFLSAKVQQKEIQRYLDLGANGVISKPFDPLSLPHEIRKILGG